MAPSATIYDEAWAAHFSELQGWYDTHGKLPRRTPQAGPERSLGVFVDRQRRAVAEGRMKEERRQKLATIPGVLKTSSYAEDRQKVWEANVAELRTWHSDHGCMPRHGVGGTEGRLAQFLSRQRIRAADGRLLDTRRQVLLTIPGALDSTGDQGRNFGREARWDSNFAMLQAWYSEHGVLPKEKSGTELFIARFVMRQREANARGKLNEQRKEKLQSIPGVITPAPKKSPDLSNSWNDKLEAFAKWVEAGNVIPESGKATTEDPIAVWAVRQLGKIGTGIMPLDRRARFMHAARPKSTEAERAVTKPFTANLPESLLDEAMAIVAANHASQDGYRSLTEFVERAVLAEVQRAQILLNDGLPYSGEEAIAMPLRVGRPLAA